MNMEIDTSSEPEKTGNIDWIENYGFILIAFAHMTDWYLAESEIQVIQEKIEMLLEASKKNYTKNELTSTVVKVIERYEIVKAKKDGEIIQALFDACKSLQALPWFDKLAASVLLQFLADIAEADHKIDKTEKQFLTNIADQFGVNSPNV